MAAYQYKINRRMYCTIKLNKGYEMKKELKELQRIIKNARIVKRCLRSKEAKSKQRMYIAGLITAYRILKKL